MKMMPETRLNRTLGGWASDVNTLVDSLLGAATEARHNATGFSPRMDIYEADDRYVLALDLPGLKPEDVHIELEDDQLVIHGTRRAITEGQKDRFYRIERVFGDFRRSIRLPRGVDREQIAADYVDGVLNVSVPKSRETAGRKIEILSGRSVSSASAPQGDAASHSADSQG